MNELIKKYRDSGEVKYLELLIEEIKNGKKETIGEGIWFNDFLLYTDKSGKSILDYIFEYDIPLDAFFKIAIQENTIIAKKLIELNKFNYKNATESIMFEEIKPGKLLIEKMFEENLVSSEIIKVIKNHSEILDLIKKYNRSDLIISVNPKFYFEEFNGKLIIDYLFESNLIDGSKLQMIKDPRIFDIITKYHREDLLGKLGPDLLLHKDPNENITYLEKIIINDFDLPYISNFSKEQLKIYLDLLVKHNKYDSLLKMPIKNLLMQQSLNKTYLDYLIEGLKKNNEEYKLKNMAFFHCVNKDKELLAQYYYILVSHDMINYTIKPNASKLMEKGNKEIRLIDALLNLNPDIISKIVESSSFKDMNFIIYLQLRGIKNNGLVFNENGYVEESEYLEKENSKYSNIVLDEEHEELLKTFRTIMLSNPKNTKEMIDFFELLYRRTISIDPIRGVSEVKHLIDIEKEKFNFSIVQSPNSSFNVSTNTVNCRKSLVELSHELGHVFFEHLANRNIPEEYRKAINKISHDLAVIQRVKEFSERLYEIYGKIEEYVEETYLKDYEENLSEERKKEIKETLEDLKSKKYEEFKKYGFSKEYFDEVTESLFSYEEYIKKDKKNKKAQLTFTIMCQEYTELAIISDIIDAVFLGSYKDEELKDSNGQNIKGGFGHGAYYYLGKEDASFNETLANISALLKNGVPGESLEYLRSIVGDEFVDLMLEYYNKNITERKTKENKIGGNNGR